MARSRRETREPMIRALKALGMGPRPRILDAGMGAGELGVDIRDAFPGAELTGIDIWLRFLVDPECRETEGWPSLSSYDSLLGGAEGELGRFFHRVALGSYDAIVLGDVLEHLPRDRALDVLQRAIAVADYGVVVNIPISDFPQDPTWQNPTNRHLWWWPTEKWLEYGAEHVGGDERSATFLWRAIPPRPVPKLSVVIPTFNRRALVDLCVRALLRTEAPPWRWEIVVVDDGSIDGTAEHVRREFGTRGVRCVRRTVNVGRPNCPGYARNVGLRAARGEWVAFLDCDVVHCRDPISAMLTVDHDAHWRCWGVWVLETQDAETGGTVFRAGRDQIIPAQMWWGCRRETLMEIGGYDERFTVYGAEDVDVYNRLGRHGLKVEHLPGQYAMGLYAPRNAGPRNVIDIEQNERQHRMAREDQTIIRNQGVDWGQAHAAE